MRKFFFFSIIIFYFVFAWPVLAQVSSSGFIPGQIWYSKDSLVEGDTVNIHTAVWNGEKDSLSTKVEFYDKNVILGTRDVVVSPSELKDVFIPWKITSGDHVISAKIISSLLSVSGKTEKIVLNRTSTTDDKQFVSVTVKTSSGDTVSGSSALGNVINKTTAEVKNIIPENVSTSVAGAFTSIDSIRDKTLTQVTSAKNDTEKKLDSLNKETPSTQSGQASLTDATEKPITYIKLFLLTLAEFIIGNKIVFYGLSAFIVLIIIRFIYRQIRNR